MSEEQKLATNTELTQQLVDEFGNVLNTLSSFKSQITMLSNQLKSLEKNVKKRIKKLERELNKNKSKGNRKASGFAVPTKNFTRFV